MKKKLLLLSRWSFALAFGVFALSYCLYHYLSPGGTFTSVYQTAATKPVVTLLVAIWGVLFLFTGVLSRLIAHIFFSGEKTMSARADQILRKLESFLNNLQQEPCDMS